MVKTVGVSCDDYKVEKFRERFIKEGFNVVKDTDLTPSGSVHIFLIEVTEENFRELTHRLSTVLAELEIEIKQSN